MINLEKINKAAANIVALAVTTGMILGAAYGEEKFIGLTHSFNNAGSRDISTKTCSIYTSEQHAKADAAFLGAAVRLKPITLLGDNNHANTNMYAVLGDPDVIKAWADNNVTDVYMEIHPDMHRRLAPYLAPFDHDKVESTFIEYFQQRGLYTALGWAELRAKYLTDFLRAATDNHIDYHFISEDPAIFVNRPAESDVYRRFTQLAAAYCRDEDQDYKEAVNRYWGTLQNAIKVSYNHDFNSLVLEQRTATDKERADFIRTHNKGGRAVVLFGCSHFSLREKQIDKGMQNMRDFLGRDQTFFLAQDEGTPEIPIDKACPNPDVTYFFRQGAHAPELPKPANNG